MDVNLLFGVSSWPVPTARFFPCRPTAIRCHSFSYQPLGAGDLQSYVCEALASCCALCERIQVKVLSTAGHTGMYSDRCKLATAIALRFSARVRACKVTGQWGEKSLNRGAIVIPVEMSQCPLRKFSIVCTSWSLSSIVQSFRLWRI
jgi:hypothetical protein